MKEQQLKDLWRNSSGDQRIQLDQHSLIDELNNKMKTIDRKIKRRDTRESVAAVIGIIGYGFILSSVPFLWSKIACLLFIAWFAYVIYRLRSTRRQGAPDLSLPPAEQLAQRKAYLEAQASMLREVFWWYILPPFLILTLFLAGLGDLSTWDSVLADFFPDNTRSKLVGLLLTAVLFIYITRMNLRAARTVYPPLIKEVQAMQQSLKSDQKEESEL